MTDNVLQDLMLENFRAIRAELAILRGDVTDIKTSIIGVRQHMSAFMISEAAHESAIASIQSRLERIERRLEISNG